MASLTIAIALTGCLGVASDETSTKPPESDPEDDLILDPQEFANARTTTHETLVPAGHGVQVTLTPNGIQFDPIPPGIVPMAPNPGTAGCIAIPGITPEGWTPSPFGECEPDVDQREWHHEPITRLVFSTNGEGTGRVNAVNFPDPWDPARHGIFELRCDFTGTAAIDIDQLFHYTEATCSLIEIGIPLWEYDEWSSHVAAGDDLIDPTQFYTMAVWQ